MMKSSKATDSVLIRKSWQVQTKFLCELALQRGKAADGRVKPENGLA